MRRSVIYSNIITKNGHVTCSKNLAAIVTYKGSRKISVKIVERKNADKIFKKEQAKYKKDNPS